MKILSYFTALATFAMVMAACESDLEKTVYDESKVVPASLSGLEPAYVLDKTKGSETILQLSWSKPDMGYQASVTNLLEMDLKEKGFAKPVVLAASKEETNYTSSVSNFNKQIMGLLAKYDMEYTEGEVLNLSFRIGSYISTTVDTIYSEVAEAAVTPYVGEAVYPSIYLVGVYCGWNFEQSQLIYSKNSDEHYTGMVYLNGKGKDGWKLTQDVQWSVNWGADGAIVSETPETTLVSNGADIKAYNKNSYWIEFNSTTGMLKVSQGYDSWSIVGVKSWNPAESIDMTYGFDEGGAYLQCTTEIPDNGTWKIVADKAWGTSEINVNNISYEGDVEDAGSDGNFKVNKGAGTYEVKWYFNKVQPNLIVTKK